MRQARRTRSHMKRSLPQSPPAAPPAPVRPSAEHAELALREAVGLMAPIAQWLLRSGVSYPAFTEVLKSVFVEAARGELGRDNAKATQSALSMLSGVHRKDVRTIIETPGPSRTTPVPTLPSQVFTRWLTDRRYRDANGQPRALLRSGGRRSFDSLCREISNDVHPRTVLEELLRLGRVGIDGAHVVVLADAFVPSSRIDEMTSLFTANASDHLAAAVGNITRNDPKFLEQSIYADRLTPASADLLHASARLAWARAFDKMVTLAQSRVDHDAGSDGNMRVRFGVYFFSEPVPARGDPVPPLPATPRKRAPRKTRSKP